MTVTDHTRIDQLAERAAKHRAILPARLTTVDGRELVIDRINETTVRIGSHLVDMTTALDASMALGAAVGTGGRRG